jgi:hypothetical protein
MSEHDEYRGLGWAHGCLTVQRLGAMLAPVTFMLADGRQISPLQIAPWAAEPAAAALPGVLRRLRGEWPCVSFGYSLPADAWPAAWQRVMPAGAADEPMHGPASNLPWEWVATDTTSLRLRIDYPDDSPIRCLDRVITPDPWAPAIDLELSIEIRAACRLPIGLHPTFRLPLLPATARLEVGRFEQGLTYPSIVEAGAAFFASDRTFTKLAAVPALAGGVYDATLLPFDQEVEELLQLNGVDGCAALANLAEGYRVRVRWQPEHFPSLLLWFSNRGRKMYPWHGRHVAVGIEPICSPFGLGVPTAAADNPIARAGTATAHSFSAGESFVTRYRIEAEPL